MKTNVRLVQDSRDEHYNLHFGAVTDFPLESNFGDGILWDIEAAGEVDCTAESGGKVCTSQTKTLYDHEFLWNNTPHGPGGADPRDSMKAIIDNGMSPTDKTKPVDKIWSSYMRGDTGELDAFDNVRSTMLIAKSSITAASLWYEEWNETPPNGVMPMGVNVVSAHDWVIVDWKRVNNIPMFLIDAHLGRPMYMSREVFNSAMSKMGVGTYMPSTQIIMMKEKIDILTKLKDALQNLYLAFQRQFLLKKTII